MPFPSVPSWSRTITHSIESNPVFNWRIGRREDANAIAKHGLIDAIPHRSGTNANRVRRPGARPRHHHRRRRRRISEACAVEAIHANLEAYEDAGKHPPARRPVAEHLNNPDFDGLLFTFVEVEETRKDMAAA
jgi:hypothetical protein